jgi:hypothetical protein
MSSDKTGKRREIEDVTAARLAEIVAAAEQAAKAVIDEAEAEARARLVGAEEEAERIIADRLATLAELTAEVDLQAEALKRQSEKLQQALAEVRAEVGTPEALGGSHAMRGGDAPPAARRGPSPSLTVVGGAPAEEEPAPPVIREARAAEASEVAPDFEKDATGSENGAADFEIDRSPTEIGASTPAGARLLATQMAVSGSTREEIEARLRSGFAIEDTAPILDAILGPEN